MLPATLSRPETHLFCRCLSRLLAFFSLSLILESTFDGVLAPSIDVLGLLDLNEALQESLTLSLCYHDNFFGWSQVVRHGHNWREIVGLPDWSGEGGHGPVLHAELAEPRDVGRGLHDGLPPQPQPLLLLVQG